MVISSSFYDQHSACMTLDIVILFLNLLQVKKAISRVKKPKLSCDYFREQIEMGREEEKKEKENFSDVLSFMRTSVFPAFSAIRFYLNNTKL